MTNKMLIDAAHPEETRVVVVRGNRVEEFDYESTFRKQLRGNIYLAKVTRVEPSLQAAFVDYGGNRHGFLAFNEIHTDYYQIPQSDRDALRKEEEEDAERLKSLRAKKKRARHTSKKPQKKAAPLLLNESYAELVELVKEEDEDASIDTSVVEKTSDEDNAIDDSPVTLEGANEEGNHSVGDDENSGAEISEEQPSDDDDILDEEDEEAIEQELRELSQKRRRKQYRIQEVIKKNQIILVQVQKEERGNKGAALTTYLSLAGRFTVLMANTARGGGISRKITNISDRKKLREIVDSLKVPEGMGLIVRTAGSSRNKTEIKRDFDYLLRIWESTRQLTLKSTAPALVYEESDLIKRSIRDLYNKDIDEILVAGEEQHREAKAFMRALMPSHAKNVKLYKDLEPIFMRFQVERQLNAMYSPTVNLKSGGYIVINQTEALVAIDVNSGKSTKEHSIEETALATNLEAIEEVARQLRLRDLAGLVVIDFIDMNERRNNRQIERKAKDCLRSDRARIQFGRISSFGLMEMSRQRMRSGVLEGSTTPCHHCQGTGIIRSTESISLYVLRSIEDVLMGAKGHSLEVMAPIDVASYILNHKRAYLRNVEKQFNTFIHIIGSSQMHGSNFSIEKKSLEDASQEIAHAVSINRVYTEDIELDSDKNRGRDRGKGNKRRRDNDGEALEKDARGADLEDDSDDKNKNRNKRKRRPSRNRGRGRAIVAAMAREMEDLVDFVTERPPRQERSDKADGDDEATGGRGNGRRRQRPTKQRNNRTRGPRQLRGSESGETEGLVVIVTAKSAEETTDKRASEVADKKEEKAVKQEAKKEPRTKPKSSKVQKAEASNDNKMPAKSEDGDVDVQDRQADDAKVAVVAKTELPEAPAGPKRSGWWKR